MSHALFSFAFLDVGTPEVMLILFVALILFGGQRLPEVARGLGKSIREFKKASAGVEEEIRRAIEAAPDPKPKVQTLLPKEEPTSSPSPIAPRTEPIDLPKT